FVVSSSRRHTRFSRDWSSDVCSSDLGVDGLVRAAKQVVVVVVPPQVDNVAVGQHHRAALHEDELHIQLSGAVLQQLCRHAVNWAIGRASCRERGSMSLGARRMTKMML